MKKKPVERHLWEETAEISEPKVALKLIIKQMRYDEMITLGEAFSSKFVENCNNAFDTDEGAHWAALIYDALGGWE